MSTPCYETKTTTLKGLGTFATHPIESGTRILSESSILRTTLTPNDKDNNVSAACRAFACLDAASRFKAVQLHAKLVHADNFADFACFSSSGNSSPHDVTIMSILFTNGFRIAKLADGSEIVAIFAQLSRINHSCIPNVQFAFNSAIDQVTVHALRSIAAGEELEADYIDGSTLPKWKRRERLAFHGFECSCLACGAVMPQDDEEVYRQRLFELEGRLFDPQASPAVALDILREQVHLLRQLRCNNTALAFK